MILGLRNLFAYALQQLVDMGSLWGETAEKQREASDLIKYLSRVSKRHPHYEGKPNLLFLRGICVGQGGFPGALSGGLDV